MYSLQRILWLILTNMLFTAVACCSFIKLAIIEIHRNKYFLEDENWTRRTVQVRMVSS